ncbi:hypothetical protein F2Q68_00030839 [Brassica cretica]|uniref:Uncharacterized protein n=1 Tax=Brassica cretica TaxID=69181 RepID=A0A8S9G9S6_BRACR|nr:hypothetical protein F2Q68_00030839 [Brassica cretica]
MSHLLLYSFDFGGVWWDVSRDAIDMFRNLCLMFLLENFMAYRETLISPDSPPIYLRGKRMILELEYCALFELKLCAYVELVLFLGESYPSKHLSNSLVL